MTGPPGSDITQLLRAWNEGDESALEKLMPIVYGELHRMARQYMARESPDHTLQTSALVNEAYLRLVDAANANWQNRVHFFAVSAQAMRRILVDWARSRQALKRGGDVRPLQLDDAESAGRQFLGHDTASGARPDDHRIDVLECHRSGSLLRQLVAVAPADGNYRHAQHSPTDGIAVAAVARVAVVSLHGVGDH